MSRQYRKERALPARFIKQDRDDLVRLVSAIYQMVGYDAVGMDYEDFALDCAINQLAGHGPNRVWSRDIVDPLPVLVALVWRDAMREGRLQDARDIRDGKDIAEDVLIAYALGHRALTPTSETEHEWACSVACMAMKQYADRKGRLQA